jgi:CheY-like chemotaxis protein
MPNRFKIMLIEDDAIEVMKFKRVLLKLNFEYTLIEKNNGREALDYLIKKENLPDIILLDLNMPVLNGFEFLKLTKKEEIVKYIPVVVLSSSDNQNDVLEAYTNGISGFIKKPLKFEDYSESIKILLSYWKMSQLVSK